MQKRYLVITLLVFLSIIGCSELETPTEEDLPSIIEELTNISDEELEAEIENQGNVVGQASKKYSLKYPIATLKKVLNYRKSQREPIYEITFNPKDWSITKIRFYYQNKKLKQNFKDYTTALQDIKENDASLHQLIVTSKNKEYRKSFDIFQEYVVENFIQEKIELVEANRRLKDKVVVRIPTEKLLFGDFTISIIDSNDRTTATNVYSIVDGLLVFENGKPLKISHPIVEPRRDKLQVMICEDLVEVVPGHNQLRDDRMNLVFMGHGYGNAFVPFLPDFVDFDGDGLEVQVGAIMVDGEVIRNMETFNGIFGEEPFQSNKDLFNIWYSTKSFNLPVIIQPDREDEIMCEEMVNLEEAFTDCNVPNTFVMNLVNSISCRSHASFEHGDSFTSFTPGFEDELTNGWSIRTIIHELGHSIGSLLDEYVEEDMGDWHDLPNCVSSIEDGGIEEARNLGWEEAYEGCSYLSENLRPTQNSIMNLQETDADFDDVNERHLCSVFFELTGRLNPTPTCSGKVSVDLEGAFVVYTQEELE